MKLKARATRLIALATLATAVGSCIDTTAPVTISPPTNVTVTMLSPTSARVSWTPPGEAGLVVSYNIFRDAAKVGESSTTFYIDNGLAEGITYKYRVSANGELGLISEQSAESPAATITVPDATPPSVTAITPVASATAVPLSATISAVFSEALDASTVGPATFIVATSGGLALTGTVTYTATTRTAEFKPALSLPSASTVMVTLTTGIKDITGNRLPSDVRSSFSTRDEIPPTVTSNSPASGSTGASTTSPITVTFSKAIDLATVNATSFAVKATSSGAPVTGAVSYVAAGNSAIFTPSAPLAFGAGYTASVSTAVKDVSGNTLAAAFTWAFVTAAAPDLTAPTIVATSPLSGAVNVTLGAVASATFSEAMLASTIDAGSVTLRLTATGAPVAGTVSYNSATNTVTFTAAAPLAGNTSYTATIGTGTRDAAGNALASSYVWSFTTLDDAPPVVTSVSPADAAAGVTVNATISIVFSEPMDPATINTGTISFRNSSNLAVVAGAVAYNAATNTATFTPSAALSFSTGYTITVSTGAKDASGNSLTATFTASFSTVTAPDITAPTVTATVPANGAVSVSVGTLIGVTFSKQMDVSTITSSSIGLLVTATGAPVAGFIGFNAANNTAVFAPAVPLGYSTGYTIVAGTGAKDAAGNALAAVFTSGFTTMAAPDVAPPTVTSSSPANGAANVAVGTSVTATFSEAMDAGTINGTTITLRNTATSAAVTGTVSFNGATNTATFTPAAALAYSTGYTLTVSTGARDAAGNALVSPFSSSFATLTLGDTTPPTVVGTSPVNGAVGALLNSGVTVTFSEPMNAATINSSSVTLSATVSGAPVSGAVTYNTGTNTATLTPASTLDYEMSYTVRVTTAAADVAGNGLASPYSSAFTTIQFVGGQPYFQGDDAGNQIHFHITFSQSGNAITLGPACPALPLAWCEIFPLNQNQGGIDAIGPPSPNQNGGSLITAVTGTFTDPGITFTFTIANGRTFTFNGVVTNSNKMTGTISGLTLPAVGLVLRR